MLDSIRRMEEAVDSNYSQMLETNGFANALNLLHYSSNVSR